MSKDPLTIQFEAAQARVEELVAAIRKHRDQRGDDRCWLDDLELYKLVGGSADNSLPPKEKFLANCSRYYDARCANANWPSYQELQAKIRNLQTSVIRLIERIEGVPHDPSIIDDARKLL